MHSKKAKFPPIAPFGGAWPNAFKIAGVRLTLLRQGCQIVEKLQLSCGLIMWRWSQKPIAKTCNPVDPVSGPVLAIVKLLFSQSFCSCTRWSLSVHLRFFCQKVRDSPTSHARPNAVARKSTPARYSQSGSAGVRIHPPLKRLRDGDPDDKGSKVKRLTCLLLLIQQPMMQRLEPFHSGRREDSFVNRSHQ